MPRLFRTTSFRLATLYAGLFVLSTGLLFGIVYWIATDVLDRQTRAMLRTEMTSLETNAARLPVDALVAEIAARLRNGRARALYYGLQNRTGRRLAGNLPTREGARGWHEITLPEDRPEDNEKEASDEHKVILLALTKGLDNGHVLTVAVDTFQTREAKEAIGRSFAWAAAVGLLLALIGGLLLSHGFLRRVDEINRATRAIIRGDLADRIRTGGTGDELDQLGANLNDMLDRLQASMEGLKQVSNDIAHDLRTPLSRLKQRLEAARHEAESTQDYALAVDEALKDANLALSTFGALLRIAQIESGSRRAQFSDIDLSTLVAELTMTYAPVAEDLGKVLVSRVDPDVHVYGDRELLTQMFANLIENALRHTPEGTTVGLSVRGNDRGSFVEVFDNGPGIPEAERDKVFGRFYRLETSRSTPGSGLGLALVAAVAALHGAQITLSDNRPGLRTILRFTKRA